MAAIAATDVTYTLQRRMIGESGYKQNLVKIDFGNGTLTYPTGGIPLTGSKMGLANAVLEVIPYGSVNGFLYKYDQVNNKIMIFQGDNANASPAPGVELSGAATPAAASLYLDVKGW